MNKDEEIRKAPIGFLNRDVYWVGYKHFTMEKDDLGMDIPDTEEIKGLSEMRGRKFWSRTSKYMPHQGEREKARRRK